MNLIESNTFGIENMYYYIFRLVFAKRNRRENISRIQN